MKIKHSEQELILQNENRLLKLKIKGLEDILKSDSKKSELVKMLELGIEALKIEEYKHLPKASEELLHKQIETVHAEGGRAEKKKVLVANQKAGSKGGKISAEQRRMDLQSRNFEIQERAKNLLITNDEHQIAGILAPIYSLSQAQIRNILKKRK